MDLAKLIIKFSFIRLSLFCFFRVYNVFIHVYYHVFRGGGGREIRLLSQHLRRTLLIVTFWNISRLTNIFTTMVFLATVTVKSSF